MPSAIARLQSLGYTCREHDPLPDADGDLVPLFYIHAPDGRATGAYGQTEALAWQAAVGLMEYRHSNWPRGTSNEFSTLDQY